MTALTLDPPEKKISLARVATASAVGTTIEYYDFFIYGTAAALVFPQVFFPALGAAAGTIASFATFAVAFFARPVGAIVFGHYGDRIGRKKTLISTLLIMGVATVLIGLLPGSDAIGVWAPVLLITLRFLQGFAVGGEWAGAALLAAEYAPPARRGFYASLPMVGPAVAFGLASATFLVTNQLLGDTSEAFLTIGWRVPFVLSALLVAVGLYIRLAIEETPVFRAEQAARAQAEASGQGRAPRRLPVLESIQRQPGGVVFGGIALTLLFAFFYIGTAFLTSYGSTALGLGRPTVLLVGIISSVFFVVATVISGWLSDRVGRRRLLIIINTAGIAWGFALFPLIGLGGPVLFGVGVTVTLVFVGLIFGPAGSFLPELFETRYRYTGAGMAYSLAGVLGGGIAPILAASIVADSGTGGVGYLLAGAALLSTVATVLLRETRATALDDEAIAAQRRAAVR